MRASVCVVLSSIILLTSHDLFAVEVPSEAEIKALIEKLASPNQRPKGYPQESGSPEVTYPAGYDRQAQSVVRSAWSELKRIGPPAFPYLAERVNDDRYCMTIDEGEAEVNWTVGRACFYIIDSQVTAFSGMWYGTADEGDPRFRARRPNMLFGEEFKDPKKFRAWCETRVGKSLRELQIESLEWTIAAEAKRPKDFSDAERRYLQETLTKLRDADEPLRPAGRWAR